MYLCLSLVLFLGASEPSAPSPLPGTKQSPILTPFWTVTPSLTPTQQLRGSRLTPTATIPPPPTPTPFTYKVKKGDTLLAIAFKYGITLDELQAANPDVNPRLLSVDTVLVIPISEQGSHDGATTVLPTPTPVPVQMGALRCYPSTENGLYCIIPVHNDQRQALENLSAWIGLAPLDGETITGTLATSPLNLLPAGGTIPLIAFFPPGSTIASFDEVKPQATLLSAFPVVEENNHYLEADAQVGQESIDSGGEMATVSGQIRLSETTAGVISPTQAISTSITAESLQGTPSAGLQAKTSESDSKANMVWLAIIAYDQNGEIVGVRKWEADRALKPGKKMPFEVTVYSLGPPIKRVEVLVEARP